MFIGMLAESTGSGHCEENEGMRAVALEWR